MYPADAIQAFENWIKLSESNDLWFVIENYFEHKRVVRAGIARFSPDSVEHSEQMLKSYLKHHEEILATAADSDKYIDAFAVMAFHVTILTHHSLYMSDAF